MDEKEIAKLQERLAKALADVDYWHLMYDKLIKHIDHQNSYVRHLEQQVWGGKTF